MPAAATATKLPPEPASPITAAEADREAADADVQRLSLAIADLRKRGPGSDPVLLAHLQNELEDAQKTLRRVDLLAAEEIAAAAGPLSPGVLQKIRLRRRRVEDLHAAVLGRMGESQRLREHLGSIKGEISALNASWEFRRDQQEMRNAYIFPPDPEARDHPAPIRGTKKTPKSMEKLALMERDAGTTSAELLIAAAEQEAASERWQSEKAVLDGWESAVRSLGASARTVLDAMLHTGAQSSGEITRQVDFRDGIPGHSTPIIR